METVKVIVNIPGLLKKGDILTSAGAGEDFVMGEVTKDKNGISVSHSARIDYYSVCAHIPTHFTWEIEDEDIFEPNKVEEYKEIDDYNQERYGYLDNYIVQRSAAEIARRDQLFREKASHTTSVEESVVYNNLVWFIDWLTGRAELLN